MWVQILRGVLKADYFNGRKSGSDPESIGSTPVSAVGYRQMVRPGILVPVFVGSSPTAPVGLMKWILLN